MYDLHLQFLRHGACAVLLEKIELLSHVIFPLSFFDDIWETLSWGGRPGNRKHIRVYFNQFSNPGLKLVVKLYVASLRHDKSINSGTALAIFHALIHLDYVLGDREFSTLKTLDFCDVERSFDEKGIGNLTYKRKLQGFGKWLSMNFNLKIQYKAPSKRGVISHGRHGTDVGREEKYIPIEVIRDLFAVASFPDAALIDLFYINSLVIDAALGGRLNELACLPLDCLERKNGNLSIKLYEEKRYEVSFRPIPRGLAPAVEQAIMFIQEHTEEGRSIAAKIRANTIIDWSMVKKSPDALEYFTSRFAHEWTRDHKLINPEAVWSQAAQKEIDFLGLLKEYGSYSNVAHYLNTNERIVKKLCAFQLAAKSGLYLVELQRDEFIPLTIKMKGWKYRLRINPVAICIGRMEEYYEVDFSSRRYFVERISPILDEALECQLNDKIYPEVPLDREFEEKFRRKINSVIIDPNGNSILEPEKALFVIPKNFLKTLDREKSNDFQMVSSSMFQGWLQAQKASEDSLFYRYKIYDPRTGSIANFVWHDIRHWLNTLYKQGGLTEQQVSLIFGRKDISQSAVYDQTLAKTRSQSLSDMLQAVRDGKAVGQVPSTYASIKVSDEGLAEKYLRSSVRLINRMPHGGCSLNFALQACPHNLSCFTCNVNGDACSHLLVESDNEEHRREIIKINESAQEILTYLEGAGGKELPQYLHFSKVVKSTGLLLKKMIGGKSGKK